MIDVTEERVANIAADIDTIIEDLEEFATPSTERDNALAVLVLAKHCSTAALRAGPPK